MADYQCSNCKPVYVSMANPERRLYNRDDAALSRRISREYML